MQFELIKTKDDGVRIGKIKTAHGEINSPFFMPVATVGSVKGVSPQELRDMGAEIVLSNTYHLYLRPGEKQIKELGGLHNFMRWDGPILTDSGGYQVFSLGKKLDNQQETRNNNQTNSKTQSSNTKSGSLVKITEEGVEFKSHLDGSRHFFTPEKVIDIQLDLGVDILMPLDVCPSGKASKKEIEEAVRLTIEWARKAKTHYDCKIQDTRYNNQTIINAHIQNDQTRLNVRMPKMLKPSLFGIVQGGLDPDLRRHCAEELIKLNFDGYSIGGLAVDHETRDMWRTVQLMGEILPVDKPRYLMGVGTPDDIIKAMHLGVDMFDCVLPTRLARHGSVYVSKPTRNNKQETRYKQITNIKVQNPNNNETVDQRNNKFDLINLLNSKYRSDPEVIEPGCDCPACSGGFSKAYISHLIRNNEILGMRLATLHNLHIYLSLVEKC